MHVRWESPSRYYEAVLQRDLLGDWVLSTANGGLRNRLGALRHLALPSRDAAVKELASLHKLRLRRGYLSQQPAYQRHHAFGIYPCASETGAARS